MTDTEKAERFARKAPPLSQAELDSINDLFPAYIFRRTKTSEIWSTCCHKHITVEEEDLIEAVPEWRPHPSGSFQAVMWADHQREPRNRCDDPPLAMTACPLCGKKVIVKELGRTGHRDNLSCWRRAVVLRWHRGALWARAYECCKRYNDGYSLTGEPERSLVGVYRFKLGLAEAATRYCLFADYPFTSYTRQDKPLTGGRWNIHGPFHANIEYGVGYEVVGLNEVQKSPFRYCAAEEAARKFTKFLGYLTACCFYPRQIEMLMKAGMSGVVLDLAERGVKHAAVIDWDAEDPKKAFRLNRQEMKAFLETSRDIQILELYKKFKGHVPLSECEDWFKNGVNMKNTCQSAKKWNLAPEKLIRYLNGYVGCARNGGMQGLEAARRYWEDYLTAAEALNYPLHRRDVLLPRKLGEAHDNAVAEHREKLEQERAAEQAERDRVAAITYEERRAELEKKYSFTMDGYMIRVPDGKDEILDEGRKLRHCVGGYADRHMRGEVTILFMRDVKNPNVPWLTIEMRKNELVQIHGFQNEGVYTAKGRFAPDPREVYRAFLDTWLDWLNKGSKRDKDGNPKLPGKKGTAA